MMGITMAFLVNEDELNRDPLSGTPGAHPLGTGAGAASGGAAGVAVGMAVGGPVGSLVGAAVGAVAGALAGRDAAEAINPTAKEPSWTEVYRREACYIKGKTYQYYAPGFRAGWEERVRRDGRTFEAAEPDLMAEYNASKSELDPAWKNVKAAARAAWNRVDRSLQPEL